MYTTPCTFDVDHDGGCSYLRGGFGGGDKRPPIKMRVYVAASCIRGSRGFRYELHGAWTDPDVAEKEILDAAKRDHVQLTKCGDRSWKGARAIVTVHTLDVDDAHSERPTSPDLGTLHTPRQPVLVLGESELGEPVEFGVTGPRALGEHIDRSGTVQAIADILSASDLRDAVVKLRGRIEKACFMLRDFVGRPAPTNAPPKIIWDVINTLDPDHIYDDGD